MALIRLDGCDAFVVRDLDGVDRHAGVARCAPKVLADSAWTLARAATYQFAVLGLEVGGASIGINAPAEGRAETIAAAVGALTDMARSGLLVDAGRGLDDAALAPLHEVDGRPADVGSRRTELTAAGIVAGLSAAIDLAGASLAVESLDATSLAVAAGAVSAGATVVAVASTAGSVRRDSGFDPTELADAFASHGAVAVTQLDGEQGPANAVLGAAADVLAVGSKLGAIDHESAAGVTARVLVPTAWVPVTTRALAVLNRAGTVVLPDTVALAGPVPSWGLDGAPTADPLVAARDTVSSLMAEILAGAASGLGDGVPVLAACERAEAFLTSRGHDIPFGRPLG
jgi:glutamate dehydrogenase/leucine dehydrogenase